MRVRLISRVEGTDSGDDIDFAVKWDGDVVHGLVCLQESLVFDVSDSVVTFAGHYNSRNGS